MKGVVWGATFGRAQTMIEKIERNYTYTSAKLIQKRITRNEISLLYDNGDSWRAVSARENMRGIRSNIAYIDLKINRDFVNQVIKPTITAFPYQGVHYFYL